MTHGKHYPSARGRGKGEGRVGDSEVRRGSEEEDDVAGRKEARDVHAFLSVRKGGKTGGRREGGGIDWNKFAARQKKEKVDGKSIDEPLTL